MFVVLVALCFLAPLFAFVRGAPSAEVAPSSTTSYIERGLPSSSLVLPIISAPAASGERNVAPHIPLQLGLGLGLGLGLLTYLDTFRSNDFNNARCLDRCFR